MSGWPMVKLGEVCEVSKDRCNPEELDGVDVNYIGLENLKAGGGLVSLASSQDEKLQSQKNRFSKGQILFGKLRPNLKKVYVAQEDGICSTDILCLTCNDRVDVKYLAPVLLSDFSTSQILKSVVGISLPRINQKDLLEIQIPFPPLNEQKRIAEILGGVQRAIDAAQKLRSEVYSLKVASLKYVFASATDKFQPLSTVASVQSGITKGRKIKDNLTLTSVPYMAVSNVKAGYLDLTTIKEIEASASEIDRFRLEDGDILLTEGGDPDKLGRGTIWRGEVPQAIHQNHIFRVRISKTSSLTPQALMAVLESRESKAYFLRSAKQTTGIASINKTQLSATPIPVLTKLKVEEATELWSSTEHIIDLCGQKLALLEELQRSLSARLFDGRL